MDLAEDVADIDRDVCVVNSAPAEHGNICKAERTKNPLGKKMRVLAWMFDRLQALALLLSNNLLG